MKNSHQQQFIYLITEEEQLEKPDQLVLVTCHGQCLTSYSGSVCEREREREREILYDNIPVLSLRISVSIPSNEQSLGL